MAALSHDTWTLDGKQFVYLLSNASYISFFICIGDHFFYTLQDRKVSPGLITGTLFLANSILGLRNYFLSDSFSVYQLIIGILIGGVLFGLPMGLCIVFYKFFDKYFK